MSTMKQFISQIREKYGVTSDYQLAQLLGVTRQNISEHKRGKIKNFSEETAYRISQLLNIEPAYVLSCLAEERADNKAIKASWKKVSRLLETMGRAAVIVLYLLPLYLMAPSNNGSLANSNIATSSSNDYVKLLITLIKRKIKEIMNCRWMGLKFN